MKPAIEKWSASGRKVYIYSSGSRQAQRLLFQYSSEGDVRPLLSGYFDTTTGYVTLRSVVCVSCMPLFAFPHTVQSKDKGVIVRKHSVIVGCILTITSAIHHGQVCIHL